LHDTISPHNQHRHRRGLKACPEALGRFSQIVRAGNSPLLELGPRLLQLAGRTLMVDYLAFEFRVRDLKLIRTGNGERFGE
jgi:hypothetical protein